MSPGQHVQRFDSALVAGLDEPIRRYLTHAVAPGAVLTERVRLAMHGRIKVGRWMEFDAEQHFDGHEFEWRARAGWRRFKCARISHSQLCGRPRIRRRPTGDYGQGVPSIRSPQNPPTHARTNPVMVRVEANPRGAWQVATPDEREWVTCGRSTTPGEWHTYAPPTGAHPS